MEKKDRERFCNLYKFFNEIELKEFEIRVHLFQCFIRINDYDNKNEIYDVIMRLRDIVHKREGLRGRYMTIGRLTGGNLQFTINSEKIHNLELFNKGIRELDEYLESFSFSKKEIRILKIVILSERVYTHIGNRILNERSLYSKFEFFPKTFPIFWNYKYWIDESRGVEFEIGGSLMWWEIIDLIRKFDILRRLLKTMNKHELDNTSIVKLLLFFNIIIDYYFECEKKAVIV